MKDKMQAISHSFKFKGQTRSRTRGIPIYQPNLYDGVLPLRTGDYTNQFTGDISWYRKHGETMDCHYTFLPFWWGKWEWTLGFWGSLFSNAPICHSFFAMEKHQWWEHRCWGWEHLRGTPKKPKKLPGFHHSGDRMPTSRTSPRRGSSCRRTVCRSSGMPCESATEQLGWGWFGKENFLGIWREAGFGQIGVSVSRKTFQRCLKGLLYMIWYVYTYISTYYTLSCNHYRYKCWYPKIGDGSKCDSN